MPDRLQKVLAHRGIVSRRQAEQLIRAGRVRLNGQVVTKLGVKADPTCDRIEVDDQVICDPSSPQTEDLAPPKPQTWLLNKPQRLLSTCEDPWGRPTVVDWLHQYAGVTARLYPVGRLDGESTGALLLSNDGDLTLKLTHPRYGKPKTYFVQLLGHTTDEALHQWRQGIELEDGFTRVAKVQRCSRPPQLASLQPSEWVPDVVSTVDPSQPTTWLKIILREGRKRQIRRVAAHLGHPVITLHREAIGSLHLNDLRLGQFRLLSSHELLSLQRESSTDHAS